MNQVACTEGRIDVSGRDDCGVLNVDPDQSFIMNTVDVRTVDLDLYKNVTNYINNNSNNDHKCHSHTNIQSSCIEISPVSDSDFLASLSEDGHATVCPSVADNDKVESSSRLCVDCSVVLHDIFSGCCSKCNRIEEFVVYGNSVGAKKRAATSGEGIGDGRSIRKRKIANQAAKSGSCVRMTKKQRNDVIASKKIKGKKLCVKISSNNRSLNKPIKLVDNANKEVRPKSVDGKKRKSENTLSDVSGLETADVGNDSCVKVDLDVQYKPNENNVEMCKQYTVANAKKLWKLYSTGCDTKQEMPGAGDKVFRTRCKVCLCVINDRNLLKLHELAMHSRRKAFACKLCRFVCESEKDVLKHLYTHSATKKFRCPQCDHVAKSPEYIKRHIKKVHSDEYPFSCDLCDYKSKYKDAAIRHKQRHLGVKDFTCDQCSFKCVTPYELRQHKLTHTNIWLYKCEFPECTRKTRCKSDLVKHYRQVHSEVRDYSCGTCTKGFKSVRNLKLHKSSHSTERPWICHICTKAFKTRATLAKHIALHSGLYRFFCHVCGHRFSSKSNLNCHLRTHVVSEQRPFHCPICQQTRTSMLQLLGHIGSCHGATHTYYCDFCFRQFKMFSRVQRHLRLKHNRELLRNPSKHYLLDILKPGFDKIKVEPAGVEINGDLTNEEQRARVSAYNAASRVPVFRDFTLPLATAGFHFNLHKTGSKEFDLLRKLGILSAKQAAKRKTLLESRRKVIKKSIKNIQNKEKNSDIKWKFRKARQMSNKQQPKKGSENKLLRNSKELKISKKKSVLSQKKIPLTKGKKQSKIKVDKMKKEMSKSHECKTRKRKRSNLNEDRWSTTVVKVEPSVSAGKESKKRVRAAETQVKNDACIEVGRHIPIESVKLKPFSIVLETLSGRTLKVCSSDTGLSPEKSRTRQPSRYAKAIRCSLKPERIRNRSQLQVSNAEKSICDMDGCGNGGGTDRFSRSVNVDDDSDSRVTSGESISDVYSGRDEDADADDLERNANHFSAPLFVSEIPDRLRMLYEASANIEDFVEPKVECLRHENVSTWNDSHIERNTDFFNGGERNNMIVNVISLRQDTIQGGQIDSNAKDQESFEWTAVKGEVSQDIPSFTQTALSSGSEIVVLKSEPTCDSTVNIESVYSDIVYSDNVCSDNVYSDNVYLDNVYTVTTNAESENNAPIINGRLDGESKVPLDIQEAFRMSELEGSNQ